MKHAKNIFMQIILLVTQELHNKNMVCQFVHVHLYIIKNHWEHGKLTIVTYSQIELHGALVNQYGLWQSTTKKVNYESITKKI